MESSKSLQVAQRSKAPESSSDFPHSTPMVAGSLCSWSGLSLEGHGCLKQMDCLECSLAVIKGTNWLTTATSRQTGR